MVISRAATNSVAKAIRATDSAGLIVVKEAISNAEVSKMAAISSVAKVIRATDSAGLSTVRVDTRNAVVFLAASRTTTSTRTRESVA